MKLTLKPLQKPSPVVTVKVAPRNEMTITIGGRRLDVCEYFRQMDDLDYRIERIERLGS